MAITEQQRLALADAARSSWGDEPATILMELLVPAGDDPVTRRDLAGLESRLETRIDTRLDGVDARLDEFDRRMDERFTRMDDRMTAFERRVETTIDTRIEHLRADLVGVFREELVTAVSGQTRAVIVSSATAVFGIGGLAVTLAQLLP